MSPFKSSLARSVGKLLGVYREEDLSLRGATQSSRFIQTSATPFTANIVMMGGGGGGGSYQGGGGGGAGGMAIFTFAVTLSTAYPFQVGNSGAGSPSYPSNGSGGIYSYFNTDSGQKAGAGGGGGGGTAPPTPTSPGSALGGSGGGSGSSLMLQIPEGVEFPHLQTPLYLVETLVVIPPRQVSHKVTPVVVAVV